MGCKFSLFASPLKLAFIFIIIIHSTERPNTVGFGLYNVHTNFHCASITYTWNRLLSIFAIISLFVVDFFSRDSPLMSVIHTHFQVELSFFPFLNNWKNSTTEKVSQINSTMSTERHYSVTIRKTTNDELFQLFVFIIVVSECTFSTRVWLCHYVPLITPFPRDMPYARFVLVNFVCAFAFVFVCLFILFNALSRSQSCSENRDEQINACTPQTNERDN